MSLVTIRQHRAMNRVGHIQDQDRTAVVAAHTHAEAVVDTHRTAVVDRHPMAAVEARRPTVAEATAIHTRTRAPAPTIAREAARTLPGRLLDENRMSDGQPTVAHFALKRATVNSATRLPYRCL